VQDALERHAAEVEALTEINDLHAESVYVDTIVVVCEATCTEQMMTAKVKASKVVDAMVIFQRLTILVD
jgi:hypothetical protein